MTKNISKYSVSKNKYTKIITDLLNQNPTLCMNGAMPFKSESLSASRQALLDIKNIPVFNACCDFLSQMKKANYMHKNLPTSYGLKHIVEKSCKNIGHVHNGLLIAAGYYLGLKKSAPKKSPNVTFWINNKVLEQYKLEHSISDV